MTLTPPSVEETRDRLARLGFDVTENEVETFQMLVTGTLETYDRTVELKEPDDRSSRETADRSYEADPGGDRLNAWAVRCYIEGADDGVLAERTVAVKDNMSVAGIPMSCGSQFVGEYVPETDATIVRRVLDSGGSSAGASDDPCANVDGLSVGMTLVGPHFGDATVLRAADPFRRATDWTARSS